MTTDFRSRLRRLPIVLFITILTLAFFCIGIGRHISLFRESLERWTRVEILETGLYSGLILAIFLLFVWLRSSFSWIALAVLVWAIFLFGIGAVVAVLYMTLVAIVLGHKILLSTGLSNLEERGFGLRAALGFSVLLGVFQLTVFIPINTAGFVLVATLPVLIWQREILKTLFQEFMAYIGSPITLSIDALFLSFPTILLLILLIYASYPESHSDALVVHLMIPHQILVQTKWSFDVLNFAFAVMPKGASWLYSAYYLLAGEPAVRLANFGMTALAAWLVYTTVRVANDRTSGALLAAVFLSAPLTSWVVFVVFEDALVSYLILASTIILVTAWQRSLPAVSFLIALLLSAAIASKIQGVVAFIPIFVLLFSRLAWTHSSSPKYILFTVIPIVLIAMVPYLTAFIITGNPVFPFANGFFNSQYFFHTNFTDTRWSGKASFDLLYRMTMNTSKFMEGSDGSFGIGHLLLFPGILVATIREKRVSIAILLIVAICFSLLLTLYSQYARYYYPTFGILAISSSILFHRAYREGWRFLLIVLLLGIIAFNFSLTRSLNTFYHFLLPNPFLAERPMQPAPVAERRFNTIINSKAGSNARVLYLIRPYGAGLDGLPLYGVSWYNPQLNNELMAVNSQIDAVELINSRHITYVESGNEIEQKYKNFDQWLPSLGNLEARDGTSYLWRINPLPVMPNFEIPFNGSLAESLIQTGWRTPEAWGVWAQGSVATWSFRAIDRPPKANVQITGIAMPYEDQLVLRVYAGNTAIDDLRFDGAQEQKTWELHVPAAIISSDNIITIRFEFSPLAGCKNNCSQENSGQLRLGMISFHISYK